MVTPNSTPAIDPVRLKKLVQRMVDIYSPSGKEEEIVEYLRGYLKRKGLWVTLQEVDERRHNLLVLPQESDIRIALVGHLDTVSAYELEDFAFGEKGDTLTGLGTADMKGGCAAMIEACLSLRQGGHTNLPVALCLVVGEEESGDGAEQLVKKYHFPWAVIGEPTGLAPCLSHYGYVEAQISTGGKRRHAALAKNPNAVQTILKVLLRISENMQQAHPEISLNIRDLYSSQAGFAVPEYCEAWLDLHIPPDNSLGAIVAEVEEMVDMERDPHETIQVDCRITTISSGYKLPGRGPVVEALKSVFSRRGIEWKPQPFKSHSDANQLWAAGIMPLLLGPGNIENAHAPHEAVSFDEVCKASKIYRELVLELCNL